MRYLPALIFVILVAVAVIAIGAYVQRIVEENEAINLESENESLDDRQ